MVSNCRMSQEPIELSVIIPVYNVEKYLERCLDSVLNQSYPVGEIICVNDGSTDGSREILERYKKMDNRICVIDKENGGIVSARKTGIACATGEYVIIVDSDDWIEAEMCADLMELAKKFDADIVTSGCIRDYGTHQVVDAEYIAPGFYSGEKLVTELLEKMIDTECFFRSNVSLHIYQKLYRRELYALCQMAVDERINVGEDAACVYPCLMKADSIVVSGKSFYHYCIRSDSTMGKKKADEWERFEILFTYLEEVFRRSEDRIKNAMLQFEFFKYYETLLQQSRRVFEYKDGKLFPFGEVKPRERIVIYGAGRFGTELKSVIEDLGYGNIVDWVDKVPREGVNEISHLRDITYDKIIIAVLLADIVEQIKSKLIEMGIDEDRICVINHLLLREKLQTNVRGI